MIITNTALQNPALEETVFHVANGYLGMRANIEGAKKEYCRGFYINGFYDQSSITYGEKFQGYAEEKQSMCKLCDVQGISLFISGKEVLVQDLPRLAYEHTLNMQEGFVKRSFIVDFEGTALQISTRRLASFTARNLAVIGYTVQVPTQSADIAIHSTLNGDVANFHNASDPRLAAVAEKPLQVLSCKANTEGLFLEMQAKHSGLRLACKVSHVQNGFACRVEQTDTMVKAIFTGTLQAGQSYTLYKMIQIKDTYHFTDLTHEALQDPSRYFTAQAEYMHAFWKKSRIIIKGDEALQKAMDYSIYCLLCSVGFDNKFSVSAKGLSGEGYEGHVFWDSEVYVMPLFIATNPSIAKQMLSYRHTLLPYALEQAQKLGHSQGALYPWRSIAGGECSAYYPAGSAQYHINADIAYACMQYYFATKDVDFLATELFPILLQTARLWLDAGHFTEKGFCIDEVTGPDEYTCLVNNNFYTNVGAKHNMQYLLYAVEELRKAAKNDVLAQVGEAELAEIRKAMEQMYIPHDAKTNINPQDDSFLQKKPLNLADIPKEKFPLLLHYHPLYLYRHQVCKQADVVLAHALYSDSATRESKQASFDYYEKICTHDSSLSLCAYAIMAAQLGMPQKAESYFKETVDLDINNTHKNTHDGIHTANMGGSFLVISKGFAGLYFNEQGLCISPNKTHSIEGYRFHIQYHGSDICIDATQTECTLQLCSGPAQQVYIYGKAHKLTDKMTFAIAQ